MTVCQADINDVVKAYAACVLVIFVWTVLGLVLYCCCLSLGGAPGLAAQYFGVVGGVQIGLVVYTVTIFFPKCPESCNGSCNDDELGWFYLVPAIEGLIALVWLRSSWNRAMLAKELTREHGGGQDSAIFAKIPGTEAGAEEVELTENSETEGSTGFAD